MNVLPTANGGTIELLYMQLYAPTTLAPPRDFWLLRYTSVLEDGSLVVCISEYITFFFLYLFFFVHDNVTNYVGMREVS